MKSKTQCLSEVNKLNLTLYIIKNLYKHLPITLFLIKLAQYFPRLLLFLIGII